MCLVNVLKQTILLPILQTLEKEGEQGWKEGEQGWKEGETGGKRREERRVEREKCIRYGDNHVNLLYENTLRL